MITSVSGLRSHYLFEDRYGRPSKGNDKGKVEGLVGYARRNFMVPLPRFESWDAFNVHLEELCRKRKGDVLRGHRQCIGERLKRDREALMALPPAALDACDKQGTRVNSVSLVRYRGNNYSVPVAYEQSHHRDPSERKCPGGRSRRRSLPLDRPPGTLFSGRFGLTLWQI